ncbi:MAG: hypothetical protein JNM68_07030 [Dinghuibacter sp.]|nr:hypothetical protein [Dinghuibacter sp.]
MRNSQVQLELGKAIKDDMVAGIRIGYGSAPAGVYKKINQTEYLTYSANHFSSGSLFLRQYARLRKNILLFIEYAATGSVGPYKTFGYDDSARRYSVDMKLRNIGVGLSLGIAYKISERVAIDLSFNNLFGVRFASTKGNYIYNNSGLTIPSSTTQFTFDPFSGARLNASFGIKIRLNKN